MSSTTLGRVPCAAPRLGSFVFFFVTALAALSGCGHVDDRVEKETTVTPRAAERETALQIVYATCADGQLYAPSCGLVTRYTATDEFRARFHQTRCDGLTDDACDRLFASTIDRWIASRYESADVGRIAQLCDAHPDRCADKVAYEEMLLDSHNAAVRERYASEETRTR